MIPVIFRESFKVVGKSFAKTITNILHQNRMTKVEAVEILNLTPEFKNEEICEKYKQFYQANSPANKGSLYIQKRIHDAYKLLNGSFD